MIADLAGACWFPLKLSLHCHETTGLVKKKSLAHCTLLTWLQTPDIPTSSGTTFYFSHWIFHTGMFQTKVFFSLPCS